MAQAGSISTNKVVGLLTATSGGITDSVAAVSEAADITLGAITSDQVMAQNIAADLAEKATGVKYPVLCVYCDKVSNSLREKFRTFSGTTRVVIEIRVSQDRVDDIEEQLQMYVDAVTRVLDANRGSWGSGMFYAGGYEVAFSAVKHGGLNFIQTAKVVLEVQISTN